MTVIPNRCTSYLPIMFAFQILLCFVVTNKINAENTDNPVIPLTGNSDSLKPNKTELSSSRSQDQSDTDEMSAGLPGDQAVFWLDGDPSGVPLGHIPVDMTWSPDLNDSPGAPEWREELEEDEAPYIYDKRFMRGFQKRFMPGFQKRFMRGFQKRFPVDDYEYNPHGPDLTLLGKRFMRGLTKRSVPSITPPATNVGPEPLDKRFMRGFTKKDTLSPDTHSPAQHEALSETSSDMDKRFMRGLTDFAKRENELTDDELTSDKRFMRGLIKKNNHEEDLVKDKRFMRGFTKKDQDHWSDEKRFMRGLIKKDDKIDDKRFMRGFTKKDNLPVTEDKRFMRGFTKKDDSAVTEDKRFMRGFTKKDDSAVTEDKKFMRGFTKKDDSAVTEDKRFMRGFTKKDDGEIEKRFMRGLIKKDLDLSNEKRFMRGFTKKDLDKRFMRGLIKKASEEKDKRFMRGLVRREADSNHRVKRQTKFNDHIRNPILEKLEGEYSGEEEEDQNSSEDNEWLDDPVLPAKRFMRGFEAYYKRNLKNHRLRGSDARHDLGKRFMRGFQLYDDATNKRFTLKNPDWYDNDYDNADESDIPEKRFIKGLDVYFRDQPVSKRFMRGFDNLGLEAPGKRFIRGLEFYEPRNRNSYGIYSKYPRALNKRYLFDGYSPEVDSSDSKSRWSSNWYNRQRQTDF